MYDEVAKKATMKYMKEKRENLTLNFAKGKKDVYKAYARSRGMSLTELFVYLIEEDMKQNGYTPASDQD